MYRGTTPTLYFKINNLDDVSTIEEVYITFKDKDNHMLTKTIADATIDAENKTIAVTLTQEDTLSFKPPQVWAQIKFLFTDGQVCASSMCEIPVEQVLNTKIMTPANPTSSTSNSLNSEEIEMEV